MHFNTGLFMFSSPHTIATKSTEELLAGAQMNRNYTISISLVAFDIYNTRQLQTLVGVRVKEVHTLFKEFRTAYMDSSPSSFILTTNL